MARPGRAVGDDFLASVWQAIYVDKMSKDDACRTLGVSRSSIYNWCKDPDALRDAHQRAAQAAADATTAVEPKDRTSQRGKMGRPGRPTLVLDDAVRAVVLDRLEHGLRRSSVCRAAGIAPITLKRWEQRAAEGEEPYASFMAAADAAESLGECMLQARVIKGSAGWQGAAWMLERTRIGYGKRDEVVHIDGGALADMDDDEVARMLADAEDAEGVV